MPPPQQPLIAAVCRIESGSLTDVAASSATTSSKMSLGSDPVNVPVMSKGQGASYAKLKHPASRYAIVGTFVAKFADGVRLAVTGAGSSGVFRVADFEKALSANFASSALDGKSVAASGLNSDIHADAAYRAHLITVMAKRAVDAAK
jgi:carbon-monoxide dehydrogenase medium subunit